MPEEEPSFLGKVAGIFEPGGDPAEIRRAELAYRTLSTRVTDVVHRLRPAAGRLGDDWRGAAAQAFEQRWE